MTTITLEYDARNPMISKTLDYILSIGFSKGTPRKTGLEEALDDVANGRVTVIKRGSSRACQRRKIRCQIPRTHSDGI